MENTWLCGTFSLFPIDCFWSFILRSSMGRRLTVRPKSRKEETSISSRSLNKTDRLYVKEEEALTLPWVVDGLRLVNLAS